VSTILHYLFDFAECDRNSAISCTAGKTAALGGVFRRLANLALKIPEGTPHKPFFAPLFRFSGEWKEEEDAKQQLESFLRSPRVCERTDDDLTLLLATFSSNV
jgi:hypothetical protein